MIEIHQNIFRNNKVIGWYRVRKDVDRGPNEEYWKMNNLFLMNPSVPDIPVDRGKGG